MLFEKQQYQVDCVDAIINALQGIYLKQIDTSTLMANLSRLVNDGYKISNAQFPIVEENRLDVLMETGTGKTFTYIQAIFDINRQFKHNKFVIVLPRTAIKQGVIQNINLTKEYFYNIYGKHLNFIDYPKDGLSSINQNFIHSNELSVLITTNSAFNSDKNNINKQSEGLFRYGSSWNGIAEQKPVVIIDEPHLLKGNETQKGLNKLTGSLFIRFGATYPKEDENQLSNVVYTLDSISAFNDYLVKQIGVHTLFTNSEVSSLHVQNIKAKQRFDVVYNLNEQLHKKTISVNQDIGATTGIDHYKGISATKITKAKVYLDNFTELEQSKGNYHLSDIEIEQMIKRTIAIHFEKEQRLFEQGIKALTLFFIPNISDFRGENPRIKRYFEHHYRIIRDEYYHKTDNQSYQDYLDLDYTDGQVRQGGHAQLQVHQGYFSGDKGSRDEKEKQAIDMILNDKEKLLSTTIPLKFIFSVWALQEGWDNPNVFTLCKLSSTDKECSRRQQIGRGLRIAVNQQGKRMTYNYLGEKEQSFYRVNALDMVVSSQEQDFIYGIQREIMEASFSVVGDYLTFEALTSKKLTESEAATIIYQLEEYAIIDEKGKINSSVYDFLNAHRDIFKRRIPDDKRYELIKQLFAVRPRQIIVDKNKPAKLVNVRQHHWNDFKTLWQAINKQSKIVYQNIIVDELITTIAYDFNNLTIEHKTSKVTKAVYNTQRQNIEVQDKTLNLEKQGYFERYSLTSFIAEFAKTEQLPIHFIIKLFQHLNITLFDNDPKQAQEHLKHLIKEHIHASIIHNVNYQFNQTSVYSNELQDTKGNLKTPLKYSLLGQFHDDELQPNDQFLYDSVVYDSNIEKQSIINDPSSINDDHIDVFAKLPRINIPTPYKSYNPDFAYLITRKGQKQLFLIVETKGYKFERDIPHQEQQKINYAKKFFKSLQQEMPEIDIRFKTRINSQQLSELLNQITQENV